MQKIKPQKTLVERTYDVLLEAICTGQFQPGERLNQDDIASRLNVSRQPVNSAISILKANHFVVDTGRRSAVVAEIDPALQASIYEFRTVIDPFAAELAATRFNPGLADEAAEVMDRGAEAVVSGRVPDLIDADIAFHEAIYRWSGNPVILNAMRVNWPHIRRIMSGVLRQPDMAAPVWQEHAAVVTAIRAGDPEAASSAMRHHIDVAFRLSRAAPAD